MRQHLRSAAFGTATVLTVAFATVCAAQTQSSLYKDPSGAFTVLVPAGWQMHQQPGSPMVSFVNEKAQASISLGVIPGHEANTPTAEKELENIQSQFPQNCPQAKITQRGATTLGGINGAFLLVTCSDGQGGSEVMKFAAASRPGLVLVLNSAVPAPNYNTVMPALNAIERSLKLSTGAPAQAAAAPPPSGAGTYRDPQGRYSLTVPAGWNVTPSADAGSLQLSSGPSWAMLIATGGAQPGDVNHEMTRQIQSQYTGFQLLNEGDLQVNSHPAHGSNATGINPKGARVSVLVLSINAGSGHFLTVVSSAPNDQAKSVNAAVMQMAQSIRFAGE